MNTSLHVYFSYGTVEHYKILNIHTDHMNTSLHVYFSYGTLNFDKILNIHTDHMNDFLLVWISYGTVDFYEFLNIHTDHMILIRSRLVASSPCFRALLLQSPRRICEHR